MAPTASSPEIFERCLIQALIVLTLLPLYMVRGEVYSSVAAIQALLDHQETVLNNLEVFVKDERSRLSNTVKLIEERRQYLKDVVDIQRQDKLGIHHPLAAYALMRDWSRIDDLVYSDSSFKSLEEANRQHRVTIPTNDDKLGAIQSLIRLQYTYNMSVEDIAAGNIRGHTTPFKLQNRDYFVLGIMCMHIDLLLLSVQWLEYALRHPAPENTPAFVLRWLGIAYEKLNQPTASKLIGELSASQAQREPSAEGEAEMISRYEFIIATAGQNALKNHKLTWSNYEDLCRNGHPKTVRCDVWCQYESRSLPYFAYKLEVMSADPWIVRYYDVLTDTEAERLKAVSIPEMSRSAVDKHKAGNHQSKAESEVRVSKVAWLQNNLDPVVRRVGERVQHITGLDTTLRPHHISSAEILQVVNYGLGGQFEPHIDDNPLIAERAQKEIDHPLAPGLKGAGLRIGTFMFYLSDTIEGGATVFHKLNISVSPVKNSAVFWYNLHRNGTLDYRTYHAGCPVLVGEKWVANKWIKEYGQTFRHPCGPEENSTELESRQSVRFQRA